jgi:hypothetical protein
MEAKAVTSEGAVASVSADASQPSPAASAGEIVAATNPAANEGSEIQALEKSEANGEVDSFCTWLHLQPASGIGELAASYPDFKLAEARWLIARPKKDPGAAEEPLPKQECRPSLLLHRLLIGASYLQCRSNASSDKCTS